MQKSGRKLHSLAWVIKQRSTNQPQMLMSQFCYCAIIWMCHSRMINNQINKLHKRLWDFFITIKAFLFGKVLKKISNYSWKKYSSTINRNIQSKSRVPREIIIEISKFKDRSHVLRKNNCIERRTIKSYKYGSETVSNLGEKLWYMVPENNKKIQSLQNFKNKIRLRTLLNCSCKLCKTFVANSGYV